jgi:hypothetical protein
MVVWVMFPVLDMGLEEVAVLVGLAAQVFLTPEAALAALDYNI